MMNKWGLRDDSRCECGIPNQTVDHILNTCPRTAYRGTIRELRDLTDTAKIYLNSLNL